MPLELRVQLVEGTVSLPLGQHWLLVGQHFVGVPQALLVQTHVKIC